MVKLNKLEEDLLMKIFLDVYLDNNLGDDIMVKGVLNKYLKHQFYTVSDNDSVHKTYEENQNLTFISKKDKSSIMNEVDVYLTLGGSVFLFRKPANLVFRLKKIMSILKAKRNGAKIITVGSNLGPFNVIGGEMLTRYELSKNDDIAVRDSNSYEYIKQHVGNQVVFSDDIVFELLEEDLVREMKEVVGISCFTPSGTQEVIDSLVNEYIQISDDILKNDKNVRISLFAFDTLKENDLVVAEMVLSRVCDPTRVTIVPYIGDVEKFLEKFSQCSKMLAVRFHSAILAEIFKIPFYPIAYSNKMENYIKDSYSLSTLSIEEFSEKGLRYTEFCNTLIDVSSRQDVIKKNIELLDKYLA